ncbi:hypothetical protein E4U34_007020 [Claviceps purpurea]|nr:hypothetical protein E4U34_007020 [Claviceps purpurea]KAG6233122.1 hypothetical protein E4U26_003113 [Claviceps purpurea]
MTQVDNSTVLRKSVQDTDRSSPLYLYTISPGRCLQPPRIASPASPASSDDALRAQETSPRGRLSTFQLRRIIAAGTKSCKSNALSSCSRESNQHIFVTPSFILSYHHRLVVGDLGESATPSFSSPLSATRLDWPVLVSPFPLPPVSDNTAKLSSPILLQRTVSYDAGTKPPRRGSTYLDMTDRNNSSRRRRSSSILQVYHEPPETLEQISDQAALPNLNANWTSAKGAWTIHIVLIAALKIFYDIIPGVSQETSWTLTNMTYMFGSYLMFHYVRGVPFEFNSGAFDNLNMWEQIDNGAQYTPTKKFLLSVPIVLFLLSTHYTHYDLAYFIINFLAVLAVVIPKLPFSHRMRFGLFSGPPEED